MPGYLIQQGATVRCVHGGEAAATVPSPAVSLGGQPASVITSPWTVVGCAGVPPDGVPPCVTADWTAGTTRVRSYGQPLVSKGGRAACAPAGTPLLPLFMQARVAAI